ncbi:MAG: EscU/YscU/HrcU family type III secretion system export apparatus switch protein [Gammaproteobacteria bacterium]
MENSKEQKIAVALHYNQVDAPTVSAKGTGDIADMILKIAEENNIPLHEDKDLVTLLSKLELGDEIPEILYRAIAEVISFAYMLTGKVPDNFKP